METNSLHQSINRLLTLSLQYIMVTYPTCVDVIGERGGWVVGCKGGGIGGAKCLAREGLVNIELAICNGDLSHLCRWHWRVGS